MTDEHKTRRAGLLLGLGAYVLWGVLPIYFKAIDHVGAVEIVAHRILWSLLFLAILATAWRKWPGIRAALASRRVVATLVLTSILIGANWLIWIYAVVSGHVLEGSLGYYLNPLVNVLFGVFLLKEKLTRAQVFAVFLAAVGVAILAAGASGAIWISLSLAFSFATYGFLRKVATVDSIEGLTIETALLTPLALGWILLLQHRGESAFLAGHLPTDVLLFLGGTITAVPLLLFTAAARRLPYSTLGFLQYIAPSLQFALAVLVYGERFTIAHAICFAAIWTALAIFAFEAVRMGAKARAQAK
ncbi:MAG TPA: EamA family transporter RarD [Allosphingosinicella sp.]|jgi:chloramphenicol-sensitive protein RarD